MQESYEQGQKSRKPVDKQCLSYLGIDGGVVNYNKAPYEDWIETKKLRDLG